MTLFLVKILQNLAYFWNTISTQSAFFVFQKIGKFWNTLLDNFIKHKPFISDEWHTLNKKEVFHPIKNICIHEAECFFSFYKKLTLISYIFALYNNPSAKLCSTWHKWQSFVFITKKALVVNAALATLFVHSILNIANQSFKPFLFSMSNNSLYQI